jgi:hypothetical protein
MLVFLDRKRVRPPLPNMPAESVVPVVAARMRGEQPVKPVGQVVVSLGPEHDMEVVGHQAPAQDAHGDAGSRLAHEPGESGIIIGAVESLGPAVAAVDHVITIAADGGTSGSWHAAIVAWGPGSGQED